MSSSSHLIQQQLTVVPHIIESLHPIPSSEINMKTSKRHHKKIIILDIEGEDHNRDHSWQCTSLRLCYRQLPYCCSSCQLSSCDQSAQQSQVLSHEPYSVAGNRHDQLLIHSQYIVLSGIVLSVIVLSLIMIHSMTNICTKVVVTGCIRRRSQDDRKIDRQMRQKKHRLIHRLINIQIDKQINMQINRCIERQIDKYVDQQMYRQMSKMIVDTDKCMYHLHL